jgi:hypothetical protein
LRKGGGAASRDPLPATTRQVLPLQEQHRARAEASPFGFAARNLFQFDTARQSIVALLPRAAHRTCGVKHQCAAVRCALRRRRAASSFGPRRLALSARASTERLKKMLLLLLIVGIFVELEIRICRATPLARRGAREVRIRSPWCSPGGCWSNVFDHDADRLAVRGIQGEINRWPSERQVRR